jgi:pimeloyl-ACP methyl ester carboxylesterase
MLTIVLVHGAFADASSWKGVVERLQKEGHTVVSAYIASVVDQIDGQVLLVGHSYAGAIISNVVAKARNVVEIEGPHLIMVSQPEAVTDVILEAARAGATQ